MSEKINDGGPAFPIAPVGTGDPRDGMTSGNPGMTLRDWFAGQVIVGLLARDSSIEPGNCPTKDEYAKECREIADTMLRAREVQP
jgi:hypothetical protein